MNNFENIYKFKKEIATENLVSGKKVYGEKLLKKNGKEYRVWNIYRSKLGAAIHLNLKNLPLQKNSIILYLGAGNGTTASHISDIVTSGLIYCVEFSARVMIDLYNVCEKRKNMIPILADANKPQSYMNRISKVDVIYADVAQRHQVDILNKNADFFLKENGWILLMVKARSIDVTLDPKKVFSIVVSQLMTKYKVLEQIRLDPYEKDHMCIVAQKK